ncbi:prenyltransferase/squalene oxidase repeat-containing protein [Tautonia marina]|uniref:prenyltransferase/squalene oxidase repeat-containing protein n=1 Tax=Tautonia marina TaxID=2653855 RepID=UPI00126058CB|nr:prenyltransferase/squalene oxidase repeat-containing protein [Tautonia marina]
MTGLNLEPFLRLLQADVGAWTTLGVIGLLLALIVWTGWGSRRVLRKCLVLSILAHMGVVFYSGEELSKLITPGMPDGQVIDGPGIREIRVTMPPLSAGGGAKDLDTSATGPNGQGGGLAADRDLASLALLDTIDPEVRGATRPDVTPDDWPQPPALDRPAAPEISDVQLAPEPSLPSNLAARDRGFEPAPDSPPMIEPSAIDQADVAAVIGNNRPADRPAAVPLPDLDRLATRPGLRDDRVGLRPSPRSEIAPPLPDLDQPDPILGSVPDRLDNQTEPAPMAPRAAAETAPETTDVADARPRPRPDARTSIPSPELPEAPGRGGFRPVPEPRDSSDLPSLDSRAGAEPVPLPDRNRQESEPFPLPVAEARPGSVEGFVPEAEPPSEADPEAVVGPDRRPVARQAEESPLDVPEADLRVAARPAPDRSPARIADRSAPVAALDLDRLIPRTLPELPGMQGAVERRTLDDVPEVYRPRLDPNRPELARRAGASAASEEAVELALDWLARHQDADGRWNAGTARYRDGSPASGDTSFTSHCPPGDICHGECFYWEADTAVTGLALLAFLGSGYTHLDGKYAPVVGRGIDFLLTIQKADGDLRGPSRAVGMYCHTMASLALSEAYALSGDPKLEAPVERAVAFLVESQYPGLMGWRYSPRGEIRRTPAEGGRGWNYEPHPPVGDTSVLGWVVMVLKSASEVGIEVPSNAVQSARNWLQRVADGDAEGLARYQPSRPSDPVMSAEAWVCRQFLGFGGPGAASTEAASYLLQHPPSADAFNSYYWYYATLAMYQSGGPAWDRWNPLVRDTLVSLQHREGHKAGSWDPDPTRYGTHGGRVYATALAAMTLEVYYRYLRLYVSEAGVAGGSPLAPRSLRSGDDGLRRASGDDFP